MPNKTHTIHDSETIPSSISHLGLCQLKKALAESVASPLHSGDIAKVRAGQEEPDFLYI